jgi:transcriptional regulator with XRE-family HTH domain
MNERLKEERKRIGLTQDAIAAIGGVSKRTLIDWEKGAFPPTSQYLAAIATAGADVQYILTGVRSGVALAADERLLLERYRASPQAVKDAALRVVLVGGEPTATKIRQQFNAPATGNMVAGNMAIHEAGASYGKTKGRKAKTEN